MDPKVLHHDRLKLCRDPSIPIWLRRKRASLLQDDTQTPSQEVVQTTPSPPETAGSSSDGLDKFHAETELEKVELQPTKGRKPEAITSSEVAMHSKATSPKEAAGENEQTPKVPIVTQSTRVGRKTKPPAKFDNYVL